MEEISDLIKVTSTLALTTVVYLMYENNSIAIKEYDLFTKKTPKSFKGFKILHLNNLYGKTFGGENFRLLEKIYELNPDIIVTSGSMLTSNLDKGWVFLELCRNLRRFYPIYYSVESSLNGDNYKYKSYKEYLNKLRNSGIILLNNERVSLFKKDERLNIYGMFIDEKEVKEAWNREKRGEIGFPRERIDEILGKANKSEFNIVLTNEVMNFESYVKWGSDITFSGYTKSINKYIFNNLIERKRGIFIEHDSSMILSRGLGNKLLKVRVMNRPEVIVITIK